MGNAHTHRVADILDPANRPASAQMKGDGVQAAKNGVPLLAFDSQNVQAFVPHQGPMGPYATPKDNIAPTADLYNNNFSILRTALELFGGKK